MEEEEQEEKEEEDERPLHHAISFSNINSPSLSSGEEPPLYIQMRMGIPLFLFQKKMHPLPAR